MAVTFGSQNQVLSLLGCSAVCGAFYIKTGFYPFVVLAVLIGCWVRNLSVQIKNCPICCTPERNLRLFESCFANDEFICQFPYCSP